MKLATSQSERVLGLPLGAATSARLRQRFASSLPWLLALVAGVMVFLPLGLLFEGSVRVGEWEATRYSLENYRWMLTSGRTLEALGNTLLVAGGTCVLAAVFGMSLAWITARTNSFARDTLEAFNLIPFFLSPLVGAISWTYIASPRGGLLNQFLVDFLGLKSPPFNIYSLSGIVWVLGIYFTPYMYLFTVGTLRKMDPALEEAARVCGASTLRTTLFVTLPMALPGILFGLGLTFISSAGIFGVPAALGVPSRIDVIPTMIYEAVSFYPPNYGRAAALSGFILILTVVILMGMRRLMARRAFAAVTGRGYQPHVLDIGRWRYLTFAYNLLFLLAAVGLPLGVLFIVSLSRVWLGHIDPRLFTLEHYHYVLAIYPLTKRAIGNSLQLAMVGATLALLFAFLVSYVIYRTRWRWRPALDFTTTLPIGVPGMVIAMGVLLAYIQTPIYGTLWILMVAYITHFLPVGIKGSSAGLLSLHPELEESARTCGAGWLRTMVMVVLPLLRPAAVATWLLLFLIFIRELNASILLFTQGNEVMSVALYILLDDAPPGRVAAYAMVQTGMILALVALIRRLAGGGSVSAIS